MSIIYSGTITHEDRARMARMLNLDPWGKWPMELLDDLIVKEINWPPERFREELRKIMNPT